LDKFLAPVTRRRRS